MVSLYFFGKAQLLGGLKPHLLVKSEWKVGSNPVDFQNSALLNQLI